MSYVQNVVLETTLTRGNLKPEDNHSYHYAIQLHRVDVTRSDGKKHTFCVGDEFITKAGNTMVIANFDNHDRETAGVYGIGSGTSISLANQLDKMHQQINLEA